MDESAVDYSSFFAPLFQADVTTLTLAALLSSTIVVVDVKILFYDNCDE